jgi:DNA topoisomerase IB
MTRSVPRLRQSDCSRPGITRRRRGRGFEFVGPDGQAVSDEETLERIRNLAIPPAWKDVWICTHPNGHLQATGVDAAGRKQYRYHDQWRTRQDQQKFDEMLDFARALPRLRRRANRDLQADWLSREQVLACAVRLLDHGFFRIGSEEYTEQNQSFGLATMLKSHVQTNGGTMTFRYQAKAGKELVQPIDDPAIYDIVVALKGRRSGGQELLAYREGLRWQDLGSADINAYLKEAAGGDFSAKDFRTGTPR